MQNQILYDKEIKKYVAYRHKFLMFISKTNLGTEKIFNIEYQIRLCGFGMYFFICKNNGPDKELTCYDTVIYMYDPSKKAFLCNKPKKLHPKHLFKILDKYMYIYENFVMEIGL